MSLIAELKRRNVFRVGAAYAIVAWLLVEVASVVLPALHLPDWTLTFLVFLLAVGFPIALIFAWAFELTPEGIKREAEVDRAESITRVTGRKLDFAIIGLLAIAVVYFAVDKFVLEAESEQAVVTTDSIPAAEPVAQEKPIRSLAVLPLENLSGDPEQEYFSDGMTEALIAELGKISALRVISRQSVMRYKGTDKSMPQIAQELGVGAVIEGSVLHSEGRVRITAQLIGTGPERHLWANNYDRDLSDILILLSEVARAIAGEIQVTLTPEEETRLGSTRPVNPEAHEAYLKGRYYWNKRTEEDIKQAIAHFQRAIEINPAYALAYAGLADCYVVPTTLPPREALPRAKAAATKALEIDNTLAEAHTSLAVVMMQYDWDWAGTEREFQRAIELNPNYATAHQWYAEYLAAMGRLDEAIAKVKRAEELDPLSLIISWNVGRILIFARQYDQALEQGRKILELYPTSDWEAHDILALAYEQKGMYDEAIAEYEEAWGFTEEEIDEFRQAYAVGNMAGYWQKRLDILERPPKQEAVNPFLSIPIYARVGEKDQAFEWLERAYQEQSLGWFVVDLKVDPMLDPLRDDPRYADLLRRMNLPDS
jgi:TolB-like protein/Tfp pilus assembly protein PilF